MAKSKQQKREEALKRQRAAAGRDRSRLIEVSNTSSQYYNASDHALAWIRCVKSSYAAHCDIYGNYLDERYYCRAGLYDFYSSHDPAVLAAYNKLHSLEELETICTQDGRTLFKTAYGTPPFVETKEPYDVNDAEQILSFLVAGESIANMASMSSLKDKGLCEAISTGIDDSIKREAIYQDGSHRGEVLSLLNNSAVTTMHCSQNNFAPEGHGLDPKFLDKRIVIEGNRDPHNFGDSYPLIKHLLDEALKK